MANLGTLIMKIGSDISGLQQGLKTAKTNISSFADSARKSGAMMSLGVTAPIVAIGKASLDMAMEAVESENLFKESMGNMANSTRAWSEQLQKDMGLNGYELRKNVALFNTMASSAGLTDKAAMDLSKSTVELSHDMASFFNVAQSDALNDLKAIITGEAEPMKKYGVLLNEATLKNIAYTQGIAKQGEKLTDVQKIQARYAAIMKATSKAQGDLARTIDSPTNRLRVLKEQLNLVQTEMGMKLIPVLLNLLKVIQPFVNWLTNLSDTQMTVIIGLAALLAVIGPVQLAFSLLLSVLMAITSPIGLVIAGLAALLVAFVGIDPIVEGFKTTLAGLGTFMSQVLVGDFAGAYASIHGLLTSLFGAETASTIMTGVVDIYNIVMVKFNALKTFMWGILQGIVLLWTTHGSTVLAFLTPYLSSIIMFFTTGLTTLKELIAGVLNSFVVFWQNNGDSIMRILTIFFTTLYAVWSTTFNIIMKYAADIWKGISLIFQGAVDIILGIIGLFFAVLDGDWKSAYDNLIQISNGFWKLIFGVFKAGIAILNTAAEAIGGVVYNIFAGLFKLIGNFIVNTVNTAISFINTLIDKLNGLLSFKLPEWMGGGEFGVNVPSIPQLGTQSIGSSPIVNQGPKSGGSSPNVTTNVYLDGKKISESVDQRLGAKVTMMAN